MVLTVRPSPAMKVRVDVPNGLSKSPPAACAEAVAGARFSMGGTVFQTFHLENVSVCTFTTKRDA